MTRLKIAIILGFAGLFSAAAASQALGLSADFIEQGLSYRLLTRGGLGAEIVASAGMDSGDSSYHFGAELRLLKYFNMDKRIRFYVGAAAGGWQLKDTYWVWQDTMEVKQEITQQGISTAALFGVDFLVLESGEGTGLSIAPEVQFGYYTLPATYYYYLDYPYPLEPERFVSPGLGISLKYSF
jgi:hypothetical protein